MAKQRTGGLGKGLDALLSNTYEEASDEYTAAPSKQAPKQARQHPETERTVVVLNADEEAELAAAARIDEFEHIQKPVETPKAKTEASLASNTERPKKPSVSASQRVQRAPLREEVSSIEQEIPEATVIEEVPVVTETLTPVISEEQIDIPAQPEPIQDRESDEIPIDMIEPNPDQPRINFKKDELEELANSIATDGLLQPILVRPMGEGRYQIIAGERRWQASKKAGLTKVPVRIKTADDNEAHILALVENIQRSDLNPIEEAYGYRRMIEQGMTQAEVAQHVSKGRSTIANALRLLDLPEDAQQLLFEEKITAGHARAILSVPTAEGKQKLTEKLIKENLSVRQVESIARLLSAKPGERKTEKAPAPKAYKIVARDLKNRLQSPVKVKTVGGKNKIEIEFKDEEDLARIFELLVGTEEKME